MSARGPLLRAAEGGMLMFWCPGCDGVHGVRHSPGGWSWNGDPPVEKRCHSWVTEGRIEFLADCTHSMAGQTVDLPAEWWG